MLVVRSGLRSDSTPTKTTTAAVTTVARTTVAGTTPSRPARYYTIEAGDTLDAIAAKFDTTVAALVRLNPGIEPTALAPGEQIRIR